MCVNALLLCRNQYQKDAQFVYKKNVSGAVQGKCKFPLVRTFKAGMGKSTNSIHQDVDLAEKWLV